MKAFKSKYSAFGDMAISRSDVSPEENPDYECLFDNTKERDLGLSWLIGEEVDTHQMRTERDAARAELEQAKARIAELEGKLSWFSDRFDVNLSSLTIVSGHTESPAPWIPEPGDTVYYLNRGTVEHRKAEGVRIAFEDNNWLGLSKAHKTAADALRTEGKRLLAQAEEMDKKSK